MNLQKQLLLTVAGLITLAVVPTVAVLSLSARQSLVSRAQEDGIQIAQSLARSAGFVERVPRQVEVALGDQMVVQAEIAAHFVSVAEQAGLTPDEINTQLKDIVKKTAIAEFWITDPKGRTYLKNIPVDFSFNPDPVKQPQAHVFWPLLTGKKQSVIQDAQVREIDKQVFKYVAVAGVDKPRIVQVGYPVKILDDLRKEVGLTGLINQLLAGKTVNGVWVVDQAMKPLGSGVAPDAGIKLELDATDQSRLQETVQQGTTTSFIEQSQLKVFAPLQDEQGKTTGATLVSLSLQSVEAALAQQLQLGILVALLALGIGIVVSLLASRLLTQPILQLSEASQAIAAGRLDQQVEVKGATEINQLATSFNQMTQQLRASFANLQQSNDALAQTSSRIQQDSELLQTDVGQILDVVSSVESGDLTVQAPVSDGVTGLVSDTLNRLIEQLGETLARVATSARQVAQGSDTLDQLAKTVAANAQEQATGVGQVLTLTEQVQRSAQQSAEQIDQANRSLQQMQQSVSQGQQTMTRMTSGIDVLQQGTERIVEQMQALRQFVSLADQFAQSQSEVASLTQMLAMSATLISARAAEQPDPRQFLSLAKEFGAIAEQVKTLAKQTSDGLSPLQQGSIRIRKTVTGIESDVQSLTSLVNDFTEGVEQSDQVFGAVQTATQQVVQVGQKVATSNQTIVQAVQSTSQAMRTIATLAEETAELTAEARQQSTEMEALSQQLLSSVQVFQLPNPDPPAPTQTGSERTLVHS